jgi:hypothetical protein
MQPFSPPRDLPDVVVTIERDGTITATMDGIFFLGGPLGRELVLELVGCIAEQHCGPIQVRIRKSGDERCARVVSATSAPPSTHRARLTLPDAADTPPDAHHVTLTGDGFIPGESVAIATIVREQQATANGRAEAVLDTALVPGGAIDIILFGATSGTLVRGDIK